MKNILKKAVILCICLLMFLCSCQQEPMLMSDLTERKPSLTSITKPCTRRRTTETKRRATEAQRKRAKRKAAI